jgi:hypothetical protein
MSNITTAAGLKNAIQKLQDEHKENGKLFKEQFLITYEIFRPANLILNSVKKFISPSFLIGKLMGPAMGLAAGYLFRK